MSISVYVCMYNIHNRRSAKNPIHKDSIDVNINIDLQYKNSEDSRKHETNIYQALRKYTSCAFER